jgi:cholesterol oxidase
VVVGSGFGGSVVACRLAEAGRSVLVLERGRPYPPGSFPRTPHGFKRAMWDPQAGLHGMYEVHSFSELNVVVASGLGGGSLIYANVMLRKPAETFVREQLGDGGREYWPVTRDDLDPHYDRVEARQRPARYPLCVEPYASTPKTRALRDAAASLGLDFELPPLAVAFAPGDGEPPSPGAPIHEPAPNLHGRPRSTCRLCGECDVGCNYGAKQTLDYTYLSDALRAGARIRACCDAFAVTPLRGGGYEVRYHQHLEARDGVAARLLDPSDQPERTVTARRVVLAAGALGSTRLLLRNRAALPGLSPMLGRRFSGNGDLLSFVRGARERAPDGEWRPRLLDPSFGPVITGAVKVADAESTSGRGYYIQDAGAPAFTEWLWQALDIPRDVWSARRTFLRRIRQRLRGERDTDLGQELSELMGTLRSSAAMIPLLGLGRDVANGRVRLRGETLELDWREAESREYYEALEEQSQRVAQAIGGTLKYDTFGPLSKLITVHPVGGCAMGRTPREGVVDPQGQVFGFRGLYVADGAVMPGPVGPNPSFTIAALADRFADAMLR